MRTTASESFRQRALELIAYPLVADLARVVSGDDPSALVVFVVDEDGLVVAAKDGCDADHLGQHCETLLAMNSIAAPGVAVVVSGPPIPTKQTDMGGTAGRLRTKGGRAGRLVDTDGTRDAVVGGRVWQGGAVVTRRRQNQSARTPSAVPTTSRLLSGGHLLRAWVALEGDPSVVSRGLLDAIAASAANRALHASAAAFLVAIAVERPFGRRSEHMALVAADLVYHLGGWELPSRHSVAYDELVRQATARLASVWEVADVLATLAVAATDSR